MRAFWAFAISPLICPPVAFILLAGLGVKNPLPGFLVAALVVAYAVTIVVGVPAYFMFKRWKFTSLKLYVIGGFVLGLLPGGMLAMGSYFPQFWVLSLVASIQAMLFWLICVREPNKSFKAGAVNGAA